MTYAYTGKEVKPVIEVKVADKTVPAAMYDVTYINNKNKGKAELRINGKEGAFGSKASAFKIGTMSLAEVLKAMGITKKK